MNPPDRVITLGGETEKGARRMNDIPPNNTLLRCRGCDPLERCAREVGNNLQWTSEHCDYGPSAS
ncbi:MAG: hypothetical protein PHS64_08005, partial [Candidatus Omnitrophica bacterium]|nr:hypothetical protein [Candidatus Omnitrophota bacterium]